MFTDDDEQRFVQYTHQSQITLPLQSALDHPSSYKWVGVDETLHPVLGGGGGLLEHQTIEAALPGHLPRHEAAQRLPVYQDRKPAVLAEIARVVMHDDGVIQQ